ncbi:BrnT family toxin [Bradyrhizobium sp.]|uniref:BrnT family toxin n=1 Tax=Bradyrhizobium sp. TaxID=376 RepID=UPI003C7535D1
MHTLSAVDYEWDPAKSAANFKKHRVRFADAALSLEDPAGLSTPDPDTSGEPRLIFLGADPAGRVLVTVYTLRGRSTRIISSRRASRAERRAYEAQT